MNQDELIEELAGPVTGQDGRKRKQAKKRGERGKDKKPRKGRGATLVAQAQEQALKCPRQKRIQIQTSFLKGKRSSSSAKFSSWLLGEMIEWRIIAGEEMDCRALARLVGQENKKMKRRDQTNAKTKIRTSMMRLRMTRKNSAMR